MLTAPTITDWMQAWAAVATAVVSILLLLALVLTKQQIRLAKEEIESVVRWNRINATFTFFTTDALAQPAMAAAKSLRKVGLDLNKPLKPLSDNQLDRMYSDVDVLTDVKRLLNLLDDYATAVRCGALDDATAFTMMRHQVARYYELFEPFIRRRRAEGRDEAIYNEFEQLALTWLNRIADERKKEQAERGVKPRV